MDYILVLELKLMEGDNDLNLDNDIPGTRNSMNLRDSQSGKGTSFFFLFFMQDTFT